MAATIVEGVGQTIGKEITTDDAEIAVWAMASIDTDRAARLINSRWLPNQIESFVDMALGELERFAECDDVLAPDLASIYLGADRRTKVTVDTRRLGERLETFEYLDSSGQVLLGCVRLEATNLIRLMITTRPSKICSLIERVEHPVLQACAAHYAVYKRGDSAYEMLLSWIKKESSPALTALAVVHVLGAVNQMDTSRRGDGHATIDDPKNDDADLDAEASRLLTELTERLGVLRPIDSVRWIGELLITAPYVLDRPSGNDMPCRVSELEGACIAQVARHVREVGSDDIIDAFSDGLRTDQQRTWTRHIADLAWEIRGTTAGLSSKIARVAIKKYEDHVAEHMSGGRSLYLDWRYWEHREWMSSLGAALGLAFQEIKLQEWVKERCSGLPLSVWDVEEDYASFHNAAAVAKHWFLVAFLAIPALTEIDRMVAPADILELADCFWIHEEFMTKHIAYVREDDIVGEHVARYAVECGEPSDTWLLERVGHPGVSPRSVWALIDQRLRKATQRDAMLTAEIRNVASDRFGDGREYGFDDLVFWGRLWILLEAVGEAEQTAGAMMTALVRSPGRNEKLILLKLLAFSVSERRGHHDIERHARRLHQELWPGSYTPDEEREERNLIDNQLRGLPAASAVQRREGVARPQSAVRGEDCRASRAW